MMMMIMMLMMMMMMIIIIITGFYIAFFQSRSKQFTVYYFGHWTHFQFCTYSALSPLPGEHFGQSPIYRRAHANSITCMATITYRTVIQERFYNV